MKALAFEARNFCIYIHKTNSYKYQVKCTSPTTSPNVHRVYITQNFMRIDPTDGYTWFYFRFKGTWSPHYLNFHVQNHKTFCIFSLLPQNILFISWIQKKYALRSTVKVAWIYNGFSFVPKHPITKRDASAVSYTHLTLPTICSV